VGDEYQLCDDLRQAVEFTRVNLAEPADTLGYRNFDVIFCRNLLIYFDDASRKAAADTFYEALNRGGYLCLGHSESMSRISSLFEVRKFPDAIVYRKSLEAK
jgi:chemotaxis protein methyltransferase CheR